MGEAQRERQRIESRNSGASGIDIRDMGQERRSQISMEKEQSEAQRHEV